MEIAIVITKFVLGFGVGWTCGTVVWNKNSTLNKVVAVLTLILWLILPLLKH